VAILPFENLATPELDWMSRGFAEAIRLQLAGAPRIEPVPIPSLRDAPAVGASEVLEGHFSLDRGRLRVEAVLEDAARVRNLGIIRASGPAGGDMLPLARSIAREIDPGARPLPTGSRQAFEAYIAAIEAGDAAAADAGFDRAVGADPGFGAAYLAWIQSLLARGDGTRAAQVLAAARQKSAGFQPLERARLDLAFSTLAGDQTGERRALVALTRADPADASVYSRLSDLDATAHSYRDAAAFCQKAFEREPANVLLLNQLGYLRAWAGDLDGAIEALQRYGSLRPGEANPSDSLGDVYYWFGRFAEAERAYREAQAKDSSFQGGAELYKIAWARLMQGDLKAADASFAEFLQARKNAGDSLVEYRQAQWEHLTGRRQEAFARLDRFASSARPAEASLSYAQLAIWAVEGRDRQRARDYAAKASAPLPVALLARFVAQPATTPAEWSARAASAFPSPAQAALRRLALAYALLSSGEFAAAVEPLQEIYDTTQPSSPDWPAVPLAWALIETGKYERASALVSGYQAPNPAAEGPLGSLVFPRVLYVRGVLAGKQGRSDEARADLKLFSTYGGGDGTVVAEPSRH
jgi:Flp pilus assembly protein TadD